MELFRLTCVTCHARLSVRDRAAVGKILACPRCGSMVQVQSPESAPLDSPKGTGDQFAATVNQAPVPTSTNLEPDPKPSADSLEAPALGGASAVLGGFRRQALAWGVAGTVSASLLVAILVWSAGQWSAETAAVGEQAALAQTLVLEDQLQRSGSSPTAAGQTAASIVDSTEASESAVTTGHLPDSAEVGDGSLGLADEPQVDAPAVLEEAAVDTLPPLPAAAGTPSADANLKSEAGHEVKSPGLASPLQRPRFDPLDLDPEGFNMASLERLRLGSKESGPDLANRTRKPPKPAGSAAPDRPATMAESSPPQPDASANRQEILDTQVVRIDSTVAATAALSAAENQLAQRFPALEIEGMPLYAFLDMISGLGNVPIQLGAQELRMAAISATAPVSVGGQQISLAEAFHEASSHCIWTTARPVLWSLSAGLERRSSAKSIIPLPIWSHRKPMRLSLPSGCAS